MTVGADVATGVGRQKLEEMGVFQSPERLRRAAAHGTVPFVWRNGPIEDAHASPPRKRRTYPYDGDHRLCFSALPVAAALRGPGWRAPFEPTPPDVPTLSVTPAEVGHPGRGGPRGDSRAMAFGAHAASVLTVCAASPPARLKSGGVGGLRPPPEGGPCCPVR